MLKSCELKDEKQEKHHLTLSDGTGSIIFQSNFCVLSCKYCLNNSLKDVIWFMNASFFGDEFGIVLTSKSKSAAKAFSASLSVSSLKRLEV